MKNGPKQSKSCSSRRSRIVAEHWRPAWALRKSTGNLCKTYKIWQFCNNKWCLRLWKVLLDLNQTQSQCCHHPLLWSQFTIKCWIWQKKRRKISWKFYVSLLCSTRTPNFWTFECNWPISLDPQYLVPVKQFITEGSLSSSKPMILGPRGPQFEAL